MRVLLCEPYFTGSHRAWAEGIATHSRHDVRLVTHHGGFWKWRMQGAALTLADEICTVVSSWGRPDVLLVSDMVHLPALLGFARAALGDVPVVLYMHENQLTYPVADGVPRDETYAMTNWLSVAAADRVVFNSEHHRRELLGALPSLLRRFPDHRHTANLASVEQRSEVLPVGVDGDRFALSRSEAVPPVVLWNHRWEHDKDPAAFFAALDAVAAAGLDFRLAVAGESYTIVPPEFASARTRFAERIVHFGTATDAEYPRVVADADVVVSTAAHEFFGVAVVEAISAGALPVLPERLSYPELVPDRLPYLYDSEDQLVERLGWALTDHEGRRRAAARAARHARQFDWSVVAPRYDALLERVARGAG